MCVEIDIQVEASDVGDVRGLVGDKLPLRLDPSLLPLR